MTPAEALQNLKILAQSFDRFTLSTANAITESLRVLDAEIVQPRLVAMDEQVYEKGQG